MSTFRAAAEATRAYQHALSYFVERLEDQQQRETGRQSLQDIVNEIGPVIEAYPIWHPLVSKQRINHGNTTFTSVSQPSNTRNHFGGCYEGLDHTMFFLNGFITCPYPHATQSVIESAEKIIHPLATITTRQLDVKLYNSEATPILVKCDWELQALETFDENGRISLPVAMFCILDAMGTDWYHCEYVGRWESMRPYLLGCPHGTRSSLFVNHKTGQSITKFWNLLIRTEMFDIY